MYGLIDINYCTNELDLLVTDVAKKGLHTIESCLWQHIKYCKNVLTELQYMHEYRLTFIIVRVVGLGHRLLFFTLVLIGQCVRIVCCSV